MCVAQLVKWPTIHFGSGHYLRFMGSSPVLNSVLTGESMLGFLLSPSLSLLPCSFYLKIIKKKKKRTWQIFKSLNIESLLIFLSKKKS